jgi:hypothetical protein
MTLPSLPVFKILEIRCGAMDWIHLPQDRDEWRALVNTAMSIRVTYNDGNSLYGRVNESSVPSSSLLSELVFEIGRAIAQAVRRRPGFGPKSGHVAFVMNKVALEQVYFEYSSFPCQFSFPPNAPYSSISQDWYSRPNGGQRTQWTQDSTHATKLKIITILCLTFQER